MLLWKLTCWAILLFIVVSFSACSAEDKHNANPDNIIENEIIQAVTSKEAITTINDKPQEKLDETTLFRLIGKWISSTFVQLV